MKKTFYFLIISIILIFGITGCFESGLIVEKQPDIIIRKNSEGIYFISNFDADASEFYLNMEISDSEIIKSDSIFFINSTENGRTRVSVAGKSASIKKGDLLFKVDSESEKLNGIDYLGFSKISIPDSVRVTEPLQNGVSVIDGNISANSAGELLIKGKNISNVKGYEFDINYNDSLISTDTSKGAGFVQLLGSSAGSLNIIKESAGNLSVSVVLDSVTNISEEEMIKIYFAAGNSTGNSQITFTAESKLLDQNTNVINTNFYGGTLSVGDLPVLLGDFNQDDVVGLEDFILFANHYGQSSPSQGYDANYDIYPAENRFGGDWADIYDYAQPDGDVDLYDFLIFAINYGQVKPGTTPEPPTAPSNPTPANAATDVPTNTTLSWTASTDPNSETVTYDVYLDKNSNPSTLIADNISTNQVDYYGLDYGSTYYWKVEASNQSGYTSQGGPWSFTTEELSVPPVAPSNPNPANNSTGISKTPTLSWVSTGATSYDIYFGTSTNPPLIKSNHTTNSYNTGELSYETKYYWKIVAKNISGNTTGTVWNFTTESQPVVTKNYRALTVGVTDYGYGDLDYTDDDSNDIETALNNLNENFAVEKKIGYVTRNWLLNRLDEYAQMPINPDDVFLFHYAGHGFYDNNSQQSGLDMSQGEVMSGDLRQKLDAIPGTKIVIIDSCESGDFINLSPGQLGYIEALRESARKFNEDIISVFSDNTYSSSRGQHTSEYEYYVMTGAAINEYSYESSSIENGYFTFFFVDGIGDVGINTPLDPFDYTYNADSNTDGVIFW